MYLYEERIYTVTVVEVSGKIGGNERKYLFSLQSHDLQKNIVLLFSIINVGVYRVLLRLFHCFVPILHSRTINNGTTEHVMLIYRSDV